MAVQSQCAPSERRQVSTCWRASCLRQWTQIPKQVTHQYTSKHTVSGHHLSTSETPFKWRFAGEPMAVTTIWDVYWDGSLILTTSFSSIDNNGVHIVLPRQVNSPVIVDTRAHVGATAPVGVRVIPTKITVDGLVSRPEEAIIVEVCVLACHLSLGHIYR